MTVFALPLVFEFVRDQLLADGITTACHFGKREPTKQINQGVGRANRVCFVPGAGTYGPAKYPGRNPRPIATLYETCDVYCWGYDLQAPNSEVAQYEAARDLHDAVYRAIYLNPYSGHGAFKITSPKWLYSKIERVFGAEIQFTLEIQSSIVDEVAVRELTPYVEVGPPTTAIVPVYSDDALDGIDITIGT